MKTTITRGALTALLLISAAPSEAALTIFGSLGNFDVFNDTGSSVEGFEIELHGVSSADVQYTFGAPYNRYGNPVMEDFSGGVFVRYKALWNGSSFNTQTVAAPSVIDTGGHACYSGGPVGNYDSSGCEHFGLGLAQSQTSTQYRWLKGNANGTLTPVGTNIALPAPVFAVDPAKPAVVQAVIEAPPVDQGFEFGDAIWLKRIKTQTEQLDRNAKLEELLSDNKQLFPDAVVETEIEWFILQSKRGSPAELATENPVGDGKDSVVVRYEFYKFTGGYDLESHEALCLNNDTTCGDLITDADVQPFRGNYIGAQMAAANLAPIPEPESYALMLVGVGLIGWRLRRKTLRAAANRFARDKSNNDDPASAGFFVAAVTDRFWPFVPPRLGIHDRTSENLGEATAAIRSGPGNGMSGPARTSSMSAGPRSSDTDWTNFCPQRSKPGASSLTLTTSFARIGSSSGISTANFLTTNVKFA